MGEKRPKIDFVYEFIMTFSNKKSLFSSKKIERFIVFWTFLIITMVFIIINIRTLEAWDFVEIVALWLAYGGYNSLMTLRDKKVDGLEIDQSGLEIDQSDQSEATSDEEGDINPPKRRRSSGRR